MVDRTSRDAEDAIRVARRAVRRLGVLSVLLFIAAGLLAVGGGALVAWALHGLFELPVRATWVVAALLFFFVPAAGVWLQDRIRVGARTAERDAEPHELEPRRTDDNGR